MERLLQHIDIISRQRNRGQLEAAFVTALRELAGAEKARLYKLFAPPGDMMVGLAADAGAGGARMLDDGISWPEGTGSLAHFPHLESCLAGDGRFDDVEPGSGLHRHAVAIPGIAHGTFGFATVKSVAPLDAPRRRIVGGLVALFRNCVAMLDYSEIDTLTGLLNRKTFDEYLINILAHAAASDFASAHRGPQRRQLAPRATHHWLGVIDIDHFKPINDRFGHLIGDEVLILVANLMKSAFRSQDKLFRFGGEEFVVLLKPTDLASAHAIFDRYRKAIDEHDFPQVGHVTVSAGFTRIGLYDTPSMILDDADEALYYAKENGRNHVCCYEELVDAGQLAKRPVLRSDVELF